MQVKLAIESWRIPKLGCMLAIHEYSAEFSFSPTGLDLFLPLPTACAVGCNLTPLRGFDFSDCSGNALKELTSVRFRFRIHVINQLPVAHFYSAAADLEGMRQSAIGCGEFFCYQQHPFQLFEARQILIQFID